jgi:hypothetical protein
MINVFTQELLDIKQELLKLKTASAKSAIGLGSLATPITITTQTADSDDYSGRSYILVQGDEPFIVQGYFDDEPNFQSDHISFIEALFFPAPGFSLLVIRTINLNHSVTNPSFTDKMTIVTTSPVVVSEQ